MSTDIKTSGVDPQVLADIDALTRHHMEGTPIDPELARRVRQRSRQATEDLMRRGVEIDVARLVRDARDEQ
jgi:hypothetical protein